MVLDSINMMKKSNAEAYKKDIEGLSKMLISESYLVCHMFKTHLSVINKSRRTAKGYQSIHT